MSVSELVAVSLADWRTVSRGFADLNYRQTWSFGTACAARVGAQSEHVAFCIGGEFLGLAEVRIKSVPVLRAGIAYINGGPLVRRAAGGAGARLQVCLHALRSEYCLRRGLVLRVAIPPGPPEWISALSGVFSRCGFTVASSALLYRTIVLDLRPDLDTIRRRLDQKWRNCLNRAEKNGLTLRVGTGLAYFNEFCDLYEQMRRRKPFHVDLPPSFYAAHGPPADSDEAFRVVIADFEGRPVAGVVHSFLGDTAVYLLGASTEAALPTKATYLLQWEAIAAARAHGCFWYDLGGIDPAGNPGVHHFKSGMGGFDITVPGPFEMRPPGLSGSLVGIAEQMYRRLRSVRRRTSVTA